MSERLDKTNEIEETKDAETQSVDVEQDDTGENPADTQVQEPSADTEQAGTDGKLSLQEILEYPQVKDFIQKVRKQEKDKLYAEIEKRDAKIRELEEVVKGYKEQLKAKDSSFNETQVELEALVKNLQASVEALKEENRQKALELFKAEKLRDVGDEIILDLVGGDSEEEIEQSIEYAKAKYQEIAERLMSAKKAKEREDVPKATSPKQTSINQLTPEQIAKMSPSEWAKYREEVKKQMGLTK